MKKVFKIILEISSLIILIISSAMFFHTSNKEDAIWLAILGSYTLGISGNIEEESK